MEFDSVDVHSCVSSSLNAVACNGVCGNRFNVKSVVSLKSWASRQKCTLHAVDVSGQ